MTYNQIVLIQKLNTYLKNNHRQMVLAPGYCHGLTLLWLFQMSQQKEAWFYATIKKIMMLSTEKNSFTDPAIEKFLAHIEWLQEPDQYMPTIRQLDMDQSMEIPKALKFSYIFHPDQLDPVLKLLLMENKMLVISGPDHTVGVYQRNRTIYFFDANQEMLDLQKVRSVKALKKILIKNLFQDLNHPATALALTFNIMGQNVVPQKRQALLDLTLNAKKTKFDDAHHLNPLYLACENNDYDLVKRLLEKNISPNRHTTEGRLPFLLCCYSGYTALVKILLEYGAEPDLEGLEGLALYLACKMGHEEIVNLLMAAGATIDQSDRDGETALFAAVQENNIRLIKLLLENQANPLHIRKDGETPLGIAMQKRQWETAKLLFQYVKKPDAKKIKANLPFFEIKFP